MSGNMSPAGGVVPHPTRAASPRVALGMLLAMLLWPPPTDAAGPMPMSSSQHRFQVMMVVLPTFKVLQVTPTKGGHEYRVWTNMKSVLIRGREYRFDRIGEATFTVAGTHADGHDSLRPPWHAEIDATPSASRGASPQGATPSGGSHATRVTVTY